MIGRLLIAGVAVLVLGACGDSTRDAGSADAVPASPAPGDYAATGLPGPFEEGDTLRMTLPEGEISAEATCNILGGNADWADGVLAVTDLGGTEMGCPGDGHAQDEWLVDFLTASPTYDVSADSVTLTRGEDRIRLVPLDQGGTPDGSADSPLTGTRWRLTGIEETDGDAVSLMAVPSRVRSTLQIEGRSITLDPGCNSGGGRVKVRDDQLRLRNVALTVMGCLDLRGEIEERVSRVLLRRGWIDWSITDKELRLSRGDISLLYRAR